eukprot:scaffold39836_cov191-Amphora_coffeaeformis.AAC.3
MGSITDKYMEGYRSCGDPVDQRRRLVATTRMSTSIPPGYQKVRTTTYRRKVNVRRTIMK